MSGFGYDLNDQTRASTGGNTYSHQQSAGTINGGWASQMPEPYKQQLETEARYKEWQTAFGPGSMAPFPSQQPVTDLPPISIPFRELTVGAAKAAVILALMFVVPVAALSGIGWATAPSTDGIDVDAVKNGKPDVSIYQTDDPRVNAIARKPVLGILKAHIPDGFYFEVTENHLAARQALWLALVADPKSLDGLKPMQKSTATHEAIAALPRSAEARIDLGRLYYQGVLGGDTGVQKAQREWRRSALRYPQDQTLHALALDGATTQAKLIYFFERGLMKTLSLVGTASSD